MNGPLVWRWTELHDAHGEVLGAMVPLSRFAKDARERYALNETYALEEVQARSSASHSHYFAALHDCWLSLPEGEAERFANEEAFRKYLLIKAGYRDERSIVCASKAEAQRVAAFVRPLDPYAVVIVSEAVVRVLTAHSQSHKAMDRKTFQESKDRVLDAAADMLGIAPETLSAGRDTARRQAAGAAA